MVNRVITGNILRGVLVCNVNQQQRNQKTDLVKELKVIDP